MVKSKESRKKTAQERHPLQRAADMINAQLPRAMRKHTPNVLPRGSELRAQNKAIIERLKAERTQRTLNSLPSPIADATKQHTFSVSAFMPDKRRSGDPGSKPASRVSSLNSSATSAVDPGECRVFRNFKAMVETSSPQEDKCESVLVDLAKKSPPPTIVASKQQDSLYSSSSLFSVSELVVNKQYKRIEKTINALKRVDEVVELNITCLANIGKVQIDFEAKNNAYTCIICDLPMPSAHSAIVAGRSHKNLVQLFSMPRSCSAENLHNSNISIMTCASCCILCNEQPVCTACLAEPKCILRFADAMKKMVSTYQDAFSFVDTQYEILLKATQKQ